MFFAGGTPAVQPFYLTGTIANTLGSNTAPCTYAVWYLPSSFVAYRSLLAVGAAATSVASGRRLLVTNLGQVGAASRAGGGDSISETTNRGPVGVWMHAAGVWGASNNNRVGYFNGIAATANTTAVNVGTTQTALRIGAGSTAPAEVASGLIAFPAIWSVDLSPAEIARLAAGASPLSVRRESLMFYVPDLGRRADNWDPIGNVALANTNATPHSAEPRIRTPKRRIWVPVAASITGREVTASGGLTFSGASAVIRGRAAAVAGGLQFGGAAAVLRGRTAIPAGGLALSGAAESIRGRAAPVSGGLTFGGAAAALRGRAVTPAGGLTFGGAAVRSAGVTRTPAGGIAFGGSANAFSGIAGEAPRVPPTQIKVVQTKISVR